MEQGLYFYIIISFFLSFVFSNKNKYRIFFIGGGFGSEYVQNIHILDTDACLKPEIISLSCHHQLQSQLRSLFNSEELADVIFIFPNERDGIERRVYAHRILLSLTCNR